MKARWSAPACQRPRYPGRRRSAWHHRRRPQQRARNCPRVGPHLGQVDNSLSLFRLNRVPRAAETPIVYSSNMTRNRPESAATDRAGANVKTVAGNAITGTSANRHGLAIANQRGRSTATRLARAFASRRENGNRSEIFHQIRRLIRGWLRMCRTYFHFDRRSGHSHGPTLQTWKHPATGKAEVIRHRGASAPCC
jgi:hypothetical protein